MSWGGGGGEFDPGGRGPLGFGPGKGEVTGERALPDASYDASYGAALSDTVGNLDCMHFKIMIMNRFFKSIIFYQQQHQIIA